MSAKLPITDPVIKRISKELKITLTPKSSDLYFDLIESIVSQQLSGSVAKTIFNRFLNLFSDRYPDPKKLLKFDDQKLRGAGLSNGKTKYIKALAEFSLTNNLNVDFIDSMSDEEIISHLTQIKGIGKWTVEMILIFSLQRPDVFPFDDLAIKKGMIELYRLTETGNQLKSRMIDIAEQWKPHRTLATLLIWKYMDRKKQ